MTITILTEAEIRQCVDLDAAALTAVSDAFTRLANGQAVMPPIMRIDVPEHNGEVDVKSAYLQGLDGFAVKLSSGFFDNPARGLPSLGGLMILLSAEVGFPQALLLDNGYLTDVRTGLAGAVAARHLAPRQVRTVGVVGAGAQARYQVRALRLVRDFAQVLVYSRTPARADAYAAEMTAVLAADVRRAASLAELVRHSDVVITTTPARTPFLSADWLHPGLHITAMGSDAEAKQELETAVFRHADLLVCDRKSQAFRLGEHHHAQAAGAIADETAVVELGELTAGRHPGRTDDAQITLCDLTGTGAQDTAIALLAYHRARQKGLGTVIES
ncbi:MAG: cyclodeaminase [Anaerolineales bacterium]|nr:cyclodeaminase [Anaerolineales bacterium]